MASARAFTPEEQAALRLPDGNVEWMVYGIEDCLYCGKAKGLLRDHGIPYEYVMADEGSGGKTAGQEAIKQNMKACLGKSMDGLLGRDWRQVYSCFREVFGRNLPARCLQLFELHDLVQNIAWTTELSQGGWKLVQ